MTDFAGCKSARPRLVVLQTHPIQYYAPLYKTIAQRGNIDIHVIYLADPGSGGYADPGFGRRIKWDIPLLEGYPNTVLKPGMEIARSGFWARHDARLKALLEKLGPDWLLLYGYSSRMNWVARRWAKKQGVRVAYTSDSNIRDHRVRWKELIKTPVVGGFFKNIAAFLCTSDANEAYIRKYCHEDADILRLPFAVDIERFAKGASPPWHERRYDFVWAGKFMPQKRPMDFIEALELVARGRADEVKAVMIGDGPLKEELHAAAERLSGSVRLDFAGFVNQKEMPAALQSAHTLVFSSDREPYGLIATEAAAAGLALIISDRIGCVGPKGIARPDENALTYPPGHVDALSRAIRESLDNPDRREEMQRKSQRISKGHSFDEAAKVIESTLLEMK